LRVFKLKAHIARATTFRTQQVLGIDTHLDRRDATSIESSDSPVSVFEKNFSARFFHAHADRVERSSQIAPRAGLRQKARHSAGNGFVFSRGSRLKFELEVSWLISTAGVRKKALTPSLANSRSELPLLFSSVLNSPCCLGDRPFTSADWAAWWCLCSMWPGDVVRGTMVINSGLAPAAPIQGVNAILHGNGKDRPAINCRKPAGSEALIG